MPRYIKMGVGLCSGCYNPGLEKTEYEVMAQSVPIKLSSELGRVTDELQLQRELEIPLEEADSFNLPSHQGFAVLLEPPRRQPETSSCAISQRSNVPEIPYENVLYRKLRTGRSVIKQWGRLDQERLALFKSKDSALAEEPPVRSFFLEDLMVVRTREEDSVFTLELVVALHNSDDVRNTDESLDLAWQSSCKWRSDAQAVPFLLYSQTEYHNWCEALRNIGGLEVIQRH